MGRLPNSKYQLAFCLALLVAEPTAAAPQVQLSASLSADFHDVGTDDAGIKLGIIDTGFAGLANAQANGELPMGQQLTDFTVFPPVPMLPILIYSQP